MATPATVEERRLEDHVASGAHRGEGLFFGGTKVRRRPSVPGRDLVDGASLVAEGCQVGGLMLEPAFLDELQLRVVPERPLDPTARCFELQGHQVVAGEITDEVRGADDDRSVDYLHAQTLPATRDT